MAQGGLWVGSVSARSCVMQVIGENAWVVKWWFADAIWVWTPEQSLKVSKLSPTALRGLCGGPRGFSGVVDPRELLD